MSFQFVQGDIAGIKAQTVVLGVYEGKDEDLNAVPISGLAGFAEQRGFKAKAGTVLSVVAQGFEAAELLLVGLGSGSLEDVQSAAAKAGMELRKQGITSIGFSFPGVKAALLDQALVELMSGNYDFQMYKKESSCKAPLENVQIIGECTDAGVARAEILTQWVSYARDLVNLPPADLHPDSLIEEAKKLAALEHVTVEVWDEARLAAEGCVGIIAVGQGSDHRPCMIRVTYDPPNAQAHVALVGKGVTYDSGGYSLKSTAGQLTMKCDMGGSATVLGAMGCIAAQKRPVKVECFVGSVENLISSGAYKLGDVLRYRNGVTVEIHNTDAEGRLVLADCLIEASKTDATHIIDVATLTGACMVAVGEQFTGLFTHNDEFANTLVESSKSEGEGLWRLPLFGGYKDKLESSIAQLKNVGGRMAGATTAALFLEHFVTDDKIWAHLDIAGPAFNDAPQGRFGKGATGAMVRTLDAWVASFHK